MTHRQTADHAERLFALHNRFGDGFLVADIEWHANGSYASRAAFFGNMHGALCVPAQPVIGERGELVCTKSFPSMPLGFWNDPQKEKYVASYFAKYPNVWCHGDFALKTDHDGYIILGRSDATLNPGGVRIGTAEIYRQVEQLDDVLESIVVGQSWDGDVRVVLFVILQDGLTLSNDLIAEIKSRIRAGATPRHVPAKVIQVTDIPRTKSGKITELAVRDVIHGREIKNTEALANPDLWPSSKTYLS